MKCTHVYKRYTVKMSAADEALYNYTKIDGDISNEKYKGGQPSKKD